MISLKYCTFVRKKHLVDRGPLQWLTEVDHKVHHFHCEHSVSPWVVLIINWLKKVAVLRDGLWTECSEFSCWHGQQIFSSARVQAGSEALQWWSIHVNCVSTAKKNECYIHGSVILHRLAGKMIRQYTVHHLIAGIVGQSLQAYADHSWVQEQLVVMIQYGLKRRRKCMAFKAITFAKLGILMHISCLHACSITSCTVK
jgi:hypothetical protein